MVQLTVKTSIRNSDRETERMTLLICNHWVGLQCESVLRSLRLEILYCWWPTEDCALGPSLSWESPFSCDLFSSLLLYDCHYPSQVHFLLATFFARSWNAGAECQCYDRPTVIEYQCLQKRSSGFLSWLSTFPFPFRWLAGFPLWLANNAEFRLSKFRDGHRVQKL